MADRSDTNHGFRKFFNDPKTSVMGYIAENIPADRLPNAAQGGRPSASPRPQYADVQLLNSQSGSQAGNLGYQNQQDHAQSGNGGLGYGAQGQGNGLQSFSLPPSFSEPSTSQGYMASNLSQHQVGLDTVSLSQKTSVRFLISIRVSFNPSRISDRACRRMVIRRTVKN